MSPVPCLLHLASYLLSPSGCRLSSVFNFFLYVLCFPPSPSFPVPRLVWALKCFDKIVILIFTLEIPSMQTSLIMELMLLRVPSSTRPRGVPTLPRRHNNMQGSKGEIITSAVNCNTYLGLIELFPRLICTHFKHF